MITRFRRLVAGILVVCMGSVALPAQAGLVSTDRALGAGERDRVISILERADIQDKLQAYGVSASDVKARVSAMSDQEVAQLAGQIDSLPAGGDGIIGALVLIFVVLLITDILGLTKIFPFTRPIR